jgi:outer membrane protein OmpA-like peptidoglycan-associated protein/Tol biopolymer transport system component
MKKIISLLMFLPILGLQAQFTESEVKNMINQASEKELVVNCSRFLQENHFYFADLVTNRLLEINPESPNYNYRKGFIVLGMSRDESSAIKHLTKATKDSKILKNFDMYSISDDAVPIDAYYHLGRSYHLDEQFEKAVENYKKFLDLTSRESELIPEAKKRIAQCSVATKLMAQSQNVEVRNLGSTINSEFADFSSNISLDGRALYLTSRRPWEDKSSDKFRDPLLNHFPDDIYQATRKGNTWNSLNRMGMSKAQFNEASVSVSSDERRVYIYNDQSGIGDIYLSDFRDGKFNEISPIELKGVNDAKWWESHYTISPDGNMIFFVSDKPDGFGKRDIYFIEKIKGNWSKPKNIGANINSASDEDSPFMGLDNSTLYFSSNDATSMGEFDIFMSVRNEKGVWSKPVNLGYPINSVGDDIYYTHTADGQNAFFTSFRKGGLGDRDIYEVGLVGNVKNAALLNGLIIHSKGKEIPESSYLTLKCTDCEDKSEKVINPRIRDGVFLSSLDKCKNYELTCFYSKGDKKPLKRSFSTSCDISYQEINLKVILDEDNKIIIPVYEYQLEGLIADKSNGNPIQNAKVELVDLNGEIESITVSNGIINSNSLKTKSFGDSMIYKVIINADGYLTQTFEIKESLRLDSIIKRTFLLDRKSPGTDLGPFSILYNFDKFNLRPDAIVILNKVIDVMNQNPEIKVELGSHTDSRGIDIYNQWLSQKRAETAANYIAKRITNPSRITYKGYGESKLKNNCTKCSESDHQINRRTEFVIIE